MKRTTMALSLIAALALAGSAFAAGPAVFADGFQGPENLAFTPGGTLYMTDTNNLWRVGPEGNAEVVYSRKEKADGVSLGGISLGPGGKLYFSTGNAIKTLDPQSGATELFVEGFSFANGNCFDDKGNFFIAESGARKILVVPAGERETRVLAKGVGSLPSAGANGLVWQRDGNILYYTITFPGKVGAIKLDDNLNVLDNAIVAKFGSKAVDDLTLASGGDIVVAMYGPGEVLRIGPGGERTVLLEGLDGPSALAFGLGGDSSTLYVLIKGGTLKFEGTKMIKTGTAMEGYRLPYLP